MTYVLHILVMINIYAILSLSLNMIVGYTGLISLSHAAFYGVGAYVSTLSIMKLGLGFLPSMLLAILCAVIASFLISIPSLRLKGDYFLLGSLAFQVIVYTILYNWIDVTRGPFGIPGIPYPYIFGIEINSVLSFFVFSCIIAIICAIMLKFVYHSPFGRVLKAVRDNELAAASLGKNIVHLKIVSFAIAAGFAAVAGCLFAGYMRYIDPTSFALSESIFALSILIIGGTGNFIGPILGTILMVVLPELLRFVHIPDAVSHNLKQVIYGLLIILVMRYMPQGIKGEYRLK